MANYNLRKGTVQWDFFHSRAKIQIFAGAFANGKTTAAVMKALQFVKDYPGSNGLIARATYPKLNDTIRREFFKWCPRGWIQRMPTQDDNTCILVNGSTVNFRYIAQRGRKSEDGSTTSNLLSATYDWIIVDQMEDPEITHKDFLDLAGRLRGQTPYHPEKDDPTMPDSGPRWMIMTCNPSFNWFFKKLVHPFLVWRDKGLILDDLIIDVDSQKPIMELFEGDLYSNRENLTKDFIKQQEALYKGQMRERYVLGKWAAFEGLVHPHFEFGKHVITRAEALAYLDQCKDRHVQVKTVEGYDFGNVSPSCYLLGFIDDYSRLFIIDGYYVPDFKWDEQPGEIRAIRNRYFGKMKFNEPIQADPAIFRRTVVAGHRTISDTLAKLFSGMGIHMRPGSNDILPGIAKINAYLSGLPITPHILTADEPGPLLYVVDDLTFFTDEISSYYWKRNPQGQHIDEPQEHGDHAMNTVKYMLTRLPEPSKIVVPKSALPPQWMFWHEMDERV